MTSVERAIDAAGGLQSTAEKMGVRYQAVQKWLRSGRVPPKRVIALEVASGVSRSELRPDLYPLDLSFETTSRKRVC